MAGEAKVWGASLSGQLADVEHWKDRMPEPFEPHVLTIEMPNGLVHVLRSQAFDQVNTPDEVMALAYPMISLLNGIMAIECGSRPLHSYGAIELQPDRGSIRRHLRLIAEPGHYQITGFPVKLTRRDAEGRPVARPGLSPTQSAFATAQGDLGDALRYFARAYDWQELWKAFEAIGAHYQSTKDPVYVRLGATVAQLARFRATANEHHRHHKWHKPLRSPRSGVTPQVPMTLKEGKALVEMLLKNALR